MTSESVRAPTPLRTMLTRTSSVESLASASLSASTEPATSALTTRLRSWVPPSPSTPRAFGAYRPARAPAFAVFPPPAGRGRARSARGRRPRSGYPPRGHRRGRDLDRHPRSCLLDTIAHEVEHRPYPAVRRSGEHGIALLERPATQQQRGDRTASGVAFPLYNVPARRGFGVRLQVLELGDDQDVLQKLIDAFAGLRRHRHRYGIPAVDLGYELPFGELPETPVLVRVRNVDLVEGHDHGDAGGLACSMASVVWGMMPSSAATTSTTTSVTLAPRARISVNASWPGVSIKVTLLPSTRPGRPRCAG